MGEAGCCDNEIIQETLQSDEGKKCGVKCGAVACQPLQAWTMLCA